MMKFDSLDELIIGSKETLDVLDNPKLEEFNVYMRENRACVISNVLPPSKVKECKDKIQDAMETGQGRGSRGHSTSPRNVGWGKCNNKTHIDHVPIQIREA